MKEMFIILVLTILTLTFVGFATEKIIKVTLGIQESESLEDESFESGIYDDYDDDFSKEEPERSSLDTGKTYEYKTFKLVDPNSEEVIVAREFIDNYVEVADYVDAVDNGENPDYVEEFDINGDGVIDDTDLALLIGLDITNSRLIALFKEYDVNGDWKLAENELDFARQLLGSEDYLILESLANAKPIINSDPLGLTDSNNPSDNVVSRVLIIDPNNINCSDFQNRENVNGTSPLCSLNVINEIKMVRNGDTIYVRGGEYILSKTIVFKDVDLEFMAYPNEKVVIRFGSFVSEWAIMVDRTADRFHMKDIEMIGNIDTPDGRLYVHKLFGIWSDDVIIENSIFRHNHNQDQDIAYWLRTDRWSGELLSEDSQKGGRVVAFTDSEGSIFRNNVVAGFEKSATENWTREKSGGEGVLTQNSKVLIEYNQFGAVGHQSISSRLSTNVIRHNTFGDWTSYVGMVSSKIGEISEWVQTPHTHTATSLYINEGSEFSGNLVIYNTANPDDKGNGLQIQGSQNSQVFNNFFIGSTGIGNGIAMGIHPNNVNPLEVELGGNNIHHNTFYDTTNPITMGHLAGRPPGENFVHDNLIHDNLIFYRNKNRLSSYAHKQNAISIDLLEPETSYGNRIYNNLVYDFDRAEILSSEKDKGFIDYTPEELNSKWAHAFGNINEDPLLVDPDNGDFNLMTGSPAIGMGTCSEQPETDYFGNLRLLTRCTVGAVTG